MNGFDSLETKERHESALTATKISDMSRHDVQRSIARAAAARRTIRRMGSQGGADLGQPVPTSRPAASNPHPTARPLGERGQVLI